MLKTITISSLALLATLSAASSFAVDVDAACAFVRIDAPALEHSCASGSFSKKGQPVYAVNADSKHALRGVVITYSSNKIGPFDLAAQGPDSKHLIGCNTETVKYRCIKATQQ